MAEIIVKDGNGSDKYYTVVNTGATGDAHLSVPGDFNLEVSKGNVANHISVNKFGRNEDVDTAAEDVWSGGGTWVAPTTARQHNIVSTSTSDTSAGTGARTVKVFGLTSWGAAEVSEDVTMNGTTNVLTVNSYVIIHRIRCTDWGTAGPNVGTITATAVTDATVTARIEIGRGQTEMAIYGIPSTQTAYMTKYYASSIKDSAALSFDISLLVNPIPSSQLSGFLVKHTNGGATEGVNKFSHDFKPHFKISGPAIIKMQTSTSANDTDVSSGFDLILVDN